MSDFYDPEYREETFTRNGISKTFRVRELLGGEAEKLFDIQGRDGKTDRSKIKGLDARIVVTAVVEYDVKTDTETDISIEQATKLPSNFRRELVKIAMDVNGLTDDAKEEVDQD